MECREEEKERRCMSPKRLKVVGVVLLGVSWLLVVDRQADREMKTKPAHSRVRNYLLVLLCWIDC